MSRYNYTSGESRIVGAERVEFVCPPFAELNGYSHSAKSPLWKLDTSAHHRPTTQWQLTPFETIKREEDEETKYYPPTLCVGINVFAGWRGEFTPLGRGRSDTYIQRFNEIEQSAHSLETIRWVPQFKVARPVKVGTIKSFTGVITGLFLRRVICDNTTKREAFPEVNKTDGETYSKDEWRASIEAYKKEKERIANDPIEKYLEPEGAENFIGVIEEGAEYTPNFVMNKDCRKRYEKLIVKDVDYLGKPVNLKEYSSKKERAYWIGKIYLHNKQGGYFSTTLKTEIANHFGVSERSVMYCAQRAAKSDERGVIKGTNKEATPTRKLEGDWHLKPKFSARQQPPWTTVDGLRPMWQWGTPGNSDRAYEALRQNL